jgi:hypothetical protein
MTGTTKNGLRQLYQTFIQENGKLRQLALRDSMQLTLKSNPKEMSGEIIMA